MNKKEIVIKEVKYYDKYEHAQRNLIFHMLNNEIVIKKYIKKKVFLPDDNYRTLANKIRYFFEEHNNKFLLADFYTYVDASENKELVKILADILSLNLGDYKDEEIEDYFNVINEYNIKKEVNRTFNELKEDIDLESKKEKLKKIIELKTRKK